MKNIEIISWGMSMYGGWYANYMEDGKLTGKGFQTLRELRAWAHENGEILKAFRRLDN